MVHGSYMAGSPGTTVCIIQSTSHPGAADVLGNTVEQVVKVEGLHKAEGNVVHRKSVCCIHIGCHHNDGDTGKTISLEIVNKRIARLARHAEIHEHQIGAPLCNDCTRGCRV